MSLLEFERDMFLSVANEDSLSISSKGVAMERLLCHLVKAYCDAANLVLVIGTNRDEEEFVIDRLRENKDGVNKMATRVTGESVMASERKHLYLSGGVLFLTSRILVVDMLSDRVPFDLVTGIVVYKAHRVVNDSMLAFILRLYRMNNKKGFITALSQSPMSFVGGFGKLERAMRLLFVRKLFLWPRFHASINASLSERSPEVIELRLAMTPLMQDLQFAIMDLISMCVKELSNTGSSFLFDATDLNTESVISTSFDKIIRLQFDPIWHQLNAKAKRLINDVKLLKCMLFHLIQYDSVTFYSDIKVMRQNVTCATCDTSDWFFWEPAEKLFVISKQRLYNDDGFVDIEKNPKWFAFEQVISEIKEENKEKQETTDVIVIVEDERTAKQLTDLYERGSSAMFSEMYDKLAALMDSGKNKRKADATATTTKEKTSKTVLVDEMSLTQMVKKFDEYDAQVKKSLEMQLHFHHWGDKSVHLEDLLSSLKPKYIILYDPEMQCIRQIEVYQALRLLPSLDKVKVYFLMFDGSAEEQRYLKCLHNEKEAFESLIKAKASLVIPVDRDGKNENHPDLIRASGMEEQISTRSGGGSSQNQKENVQQKVIVDMREFRSDLPSLLHKRGIDIEPITMEIGDYLITPDTCVERKSVSDLIGSLNSGRLYHQAQIMIRYYRRSLLLIEFDEQRSFTFKGRYWGLNSTSSSSSNRQNNILTKLIVLTIHFPQLRIIWSPSPHYSAEILENLKEGHEQPDANSQLTASSSEQLPAQYSKDKYDIATKEFLLCLPGVNDKNVYQIMNGVNCIADLVELTIEQVTELMGSAMHAQLLFKALHSSLGSFAKGNEEKNDKSKSKRFVKKPKLNKPTQSSEQTNKITNYIKEKTV